MKAVFRHELAGYFTGLTGYVFGAFLLLFGGIYTMVICLNAGSANYEYVLTNLAFLFLIVVPVLTMGAIAQEKRQKTDQLLYSLPLSMTGVTLGKYLAMLVVFLLPVGILCLYPILLSAFGSIYLPAVFSTAVGFLFLGAALLSVGLFLSSLTESQGVAAGLCFVVLLVCYFLPDLTGYFSTSALASFAAFTAVVLLVGLIFRLMTQNTPVSVALIAVLEIALLLGYVLGGDSFAGLFPTLVEKLSLFDRFYDFAEGICDVTTLVYFGTVIPVFLFLTVQSLEKRRWSA
ncbi:ABC transporter permease [Evtepia sp.]